MRGRVGFGVGLLLAAAVAAAEQVDMAPSPALRCLTVAAGEREAPEYPFDAFKAGERGSVRVLLEFDRPDAPPRATVQSHSGWPFAEAVRAHARHLRVPCLESGSPPARLLREYVFQPDDRQVHWYRTLDADAEANAEAWKCVRHVRGSDQPDFPSAMLRRGVQGRVVVEALFEAPDRPPVLKVNSQRSANMLALAVSRWLQDTRMPCHPGRPVTAYVTYEFLIEGAGRYGFKEVTFRNLLAATAGIERQRLAFDTTTMGCPFDVKLWYRQPHLPNRVGEMGQSNPARRPLLEWMETVEFKMRQADLDTIYGDSTVITVPCIRVDLKPKE
jgi:hypothetical protein